LARGTGSCPARAFHLEKGTAKRLAHCYSAIFRRRINTFRRSDPVLKVIGNYEPFNTSIYSPESALAKVIQGKKLSMNNWNTLHNTDKFQQQVFKAFGLPRAD
jgi:hypothetical protein